MCYIDIQEMWYFVGGEETEDGLKLFIDDAGALEIVEIAREHGQL